MVVVLILSVAVFVLVVTREYRLCRDRAIAFLVGRVPVEHVSRAWDSSRAALALPHARFCRGKKIRGPTRTVASCWFWSYRTGGY